MVLESYVDESSQTQNRYLVLGATCVSAARRAEIDLALRDVRKPALPGGELKWGKVSAGKLVQYRRIVDFFFALIDQGWLSWHGMAVDTSGTRGGKRFAGDRELGFNSLLYRFLLHRICGRYREIGRHHIYLDSRTTRYSLEHLRTLLNQGAAMHYRMNGHPVRRLHFLDSKRSQLLQVNDVILGAIAARLNGHHLRPDASCAKASLSGHILKRAGIVDLQIGTDGDAPFTLSHFGRREKQ